MRLWMIGVLGVVAVGAEAARGDSSYFVWSGPEGVGVLAPDRCAVNSAFSGHWWVEPDFAVWEFRGHAHAPDMPTVAIGAPARVLGVYPGYSGPLCRYRVMGTPEGAPGGEYVAGGVVIAEPYVVAPE